MHLLQRPGDEAISSMDALTERPSGAASAIQAAGESNYNAGKTALGKLRVSAC
jgi:hypothetical protein